MLTEHGSPATATRQEPARPGTERLRVVHVMESTIGGTRRHLVDAALGGVAAGLDVHVIASCRRHAEFRADLGAMRDAGVDVRELGMVRSIRPGIDCAHLMQLRGMLREIRPDVVHTHSSKAGVLGRLASTSTGIGARVHTPHTFAFLFEHMFGPAKRRLFRWVETRLARRTDLFVAVGAGEGETMSSSGVVDPARVRVVPNGIDPEPFESALPLERSELGARPGDVLVAVIGLLNVAKGQDLAIRALAEPGNERVRLLLVGHGETEGELRDLATSLGVAERVAFLGWRSDVPRILRTLDVLVLPSRWEGLPYIVLEAMAAGVPVVASRVDGARDLLGGERSAFVFDIESVAGLGRALARIAALEPDERRRLGAIGRAEVRRAHTRETMVAGLTAVYREALAIASTRRGRTA